MISFDKTFEHEGDFSNHPNDKGGPTRYGISARAFGHYFGFEPTAPQMATLTKSAAELIAREYYYIAPGFDKLPDRIAVQMFDIGFNMGPSRAWKLLQRVVGTVEDGIFGPKSWSCFDEVRDAYGLEYVNSELVSARLAFYEGVIRRDPTQAVFERGWRRRAESFLYT